MLKIERVIKAGKTVPLRLRRKKLVARLCYVWTGKLHVVRIKDAPTNSAASSTRKAFDSRFQT
jgi:hypothetical protein